MTNSTYSNKWKIYTVDQYQARTPIGIVEGERKMQRLVRILRAKPGILYVDAQRLKKYQVGEKPNVSGKTRAKQATL